MFVNCRHKFVALGAIKDFDEGSGMESAGQSSGTSGRDKYRLIPNRHHGNEVNYTAGGQLIKEVVGNN